MKSVAFKPYPSAKSSTHFEMNGNLLNKHVPHLDPLFKIGSKGSQKNKSVCFQGKSA